MEPKVICQISNFKFQLKTKGSPYGKIRTANATADAGGQLPGNMCEYIDGGILLLPKKEPNNNFTFQFSIHKNRKLNQIATFDFQKRNHDFYLKKRAPFGTFYYCWRGRADAGIIWEHIDGGMPPLPKAARPAAADGFDECRTESTSIGAGPTFSKYLGSTGFTMECATAATPCTRRTRNQVQAK